MWWAVGLQVEAAYGINILKYTETLSSTSSASSPFEIIRGLGYWFFYGASDQTGPWTQAAVAYTQELWLIGLTFLVPTMALLAAAVVRWRQRAYFVFLVWWWHGAGRRPLPLLHADRGQRAASRRSCSTPRRGSPCARPTGRRPW